MNEPQQQQEHEGMVKPWLLVVLLVFFLVAAGCISWWYWQNKSSGLNRSSQTKQSTKAILPFSASGEEFSYESSKFNGSDWEVLDKQGEVSFLSKAKAAEAEKIIDFSKKYLTLDSFQAIKKINNSEFLLGGGTNDHVTLYKTNFKKTNIDLSTQLPKIQGNSIIESIDSDGTNWLIGLSNTGGEKAQLIKFDGKNFTDNSDKLNMTAQSSVETIKFNKNYWLIATSTTSGDYRQNKIIKVTNNNFEDITSLLPGELAKYNTSVIKAIECNNDFCLLGGASYEPSYANSSSFLVKYDGRRFTDLSANIPRKSIQTDVSPAAASIKTISWNGKKFLIGGQDEVAPDFHPLLYEYDGSQFTDLSEYIKGHMITALANDGDRWLIGVFGQQSIELYRYDSQNFYKIPVKILVLDSNSINAIAKDGDHSFILGGWQSLIFKLKFTKN